MRLRDIGQVDRYLAQRPVYADPFWDNDHGAICAWDITLYRARMSALGLAGEAEGAIEILANEVAAHATQLGNTALIGMRGAPRRFLVDELVLALGRLPKVRAQAALFSLEQQMAPAEVMEMTWSEVLRMTPRTQLGIDLLRERNRVRHLRLPYVFWEWATENIAAPLLQLSEELERAFDMPWHEVVTAYTEILMIDTRAEAESFKQMVAS